MMAGAGSSSELSGLISVKLASLYRKEVAEEQTSVFAGAGKPRTLRRLSETEIVERKRKLSAYDASLPDTSRGAKGKWAKKINSLIADTKDIKEATTQIKEAQEGIKKDTTCILGLLKGQEVERDTVRVTKNASSKSARSSGSWTMRLLTSRSARRSVFAQKRYRAAWQLKKLFRKPSVA